MFNRGLEVGARGREERGGREATGARGKGSRAHTKQIEGLRANPPAAEEVPFSLPWLGGRELRVAAGANFALPFRLARHVVAVGADFAVLFEADAASVAEREVGLDIAPQRGGGGATAGAAFLLSRLGQPRARRVAAAALGSHAGYAQRPKESI
jgi:hypothetical protein